MDKLVEWYSNPENIKRLTSWLRKYIRVNGLFRTQDDVNFTIEDIIQTALYKLLKKGGQNYIKGCTIDTMVFKIAINNAISEIRTRERQKNISLEYADVYDLGLFVNIKNSRPYLSPDSSPDRNAENNELGRDIDSSIDRLMEKYKEPFLLWAQGYTYHDMSDILKKPVGTVKSGVYRAREIFKNNKLIKKHYEATKL